MFQSINKLINRQGSQRTALSISGGCMGQFCLTWSSRAGLGGVDVLITFRLSRQEKLNISMHLLSLPLKYTVLVLWVFLAVLLTSTHTDTQISNVLVLMVANHCGSKRITFSHSVLRFKPAQFQEGFLPPHLLLSSTLGHASTKN